MTTDQLSEHEQAQLRFLEIDLQLSFWRMVDILITIENDRLYREQYSTFEDYMMERYPQLTGDKPKRGSTWRQWRTYWKANNLAETFGVSLANRHAGRALCACEDSLRGLIVQKAIEYEEMKNGEKPEQLTAAMIKPVADEIKQVLDEARDTGHVDTGDGSMSAFGAAVEQSLQERLLRQRQHIRDGAKTRGGWSEPIVIPNDEDEYSLYKFLKTITTGKPLEVKWRVVEEPEGETNGT
jgi:hypothetical protein